MRARTFRRASPVVWVVVPERRPRRWQDGRVGSLMLLDSASLYFRAYFGVPETLTAPDGTPVNAVRGLLDMITRLVRARHPARLVACLDADWRPSFRVAAVPSYKTHRLRSGGQNEEEVPPALEAQVPVIEQVLAAAGVAMAAAEGYEADDVIGTLTAGSPGPVDIVTGDRDLFQLVDDAKPARVIYTARGLTKLDVIDEAAITARYHIPGRAYADYATLRGDPSDGLPGVPGVGEKTAAALVRAFGSVEAILAAIDKGHGGFPAGSRPKVAAARDYLEVAPAVVRVATDAPVPPVDGALPVSPADPGALNALDARWDLGTSLRRAVAALSGE
jgi:5'-3' exonuclease